MTRIKVQPINTEVESHPGQNLRDALQQNGINLESPCNGKGICGGCRVWITDPWIEPTAHDSISETEARQGCRLSCMIQPDQDMTVRLPMDFAQDGKRLRESQNILEGDLAPTARLVSAIKITAHQGQFFMRYDNLPEYTELSDWSWVHEAKGLAIDLGTTTIVVTLLSLRNGKELATASRLNPQIKFGHDVLTRIQHGSTAEGLQELACSVQEGINELIEEVCADSGSKTSEILDVVLGGNTTMLQIIAGIDPAPLGQIPFPVNLESGTSYPVHDLGLQANPAARVYVPPVIHAFIGSDISAGLLVHGDFFQSDQNILFVDVGTNGEIALNAGGRRLACSAAAGPAFEGMGLSCGMRATIGAVEAVNCIEQDLQISTVGNVPARGVCGSGLVDLVSALLYLGILDRTGKFKTTTPEDLPPAIRARIQDREGQACFALSSRAAFTQHDVRQVQLAKGAIRAGQEILLQEAGITAKDLHSIYIAGGFGYFLNPRNLEHIGLVPENCQDKIIFTGNACRSGCVWLLTDISYRRFLEESLRDIEHISIAESLEFMELYAQSMEF